jgi:hypothetical protein
MKSLFTKLSVALLIVGITSTNISYIYAQPTEEEVVSAFDDAKKLIDEMSESSMELENAYPEATENIVETKEIVEDLTDTYGDALEVFDSALGTDEDSDTVINAIKSVFTDFSDFTSFFRYLIISVLVMSAIVLIFNIVMIMDCLKRDFNEKTAWLIVLILGLFLGFGFISSIVYYFAVRKNKSLSTVDQPVPSQPPAVGESTI